MNTTRIAFLTFYLLICSITSFAQPSTEAAGKADTYITRILSAIPDIPGVSVVVIKNDQPVFMKSYGWADREKNLRADENTLYYIASSTKSFTAMAAAILDHEGKMKLDGPMRKYLPGFSFRNPVPDDKVTLRQLLTHTSGMENDALTFRVAYTGQVDEADILKTFRDETSFKAANYGKYNYDNLGYNIYAVILQQSLGMAWQDLVQEKIFTPLGMDHSTTYISKAASRHWTVAAPYLAFYEKSFIRSWLDKQDNNMQSAGGIYTSIKDLATWLRMNMNEGKLNGRQVIPAAVVKACHTGYTVTERDTEPFTGKGEYGLGWQIGNYHTQKVIYHFGGFPGFSSHISFMPEQKLGVAVMVNEGNLGSRVMSLIATYVYDLWLGQESNIDALYEDRLKDLVTRLEASRKRVQDGMAERAKRTWQLSQRLEAYTGKYVNEYYGTIDISVVNNALAVKMGNMQCTPTPFTNKESIRIEMIPGTGQVLQFSTDAAGKIATLEYDKIIFTKK